MLFALGFVSMFVIGGLSGIYLGSVPIDIHASDTYFIVAHIHYVLFGGSVFTIFAGVYYWFPKMTGRMYNERLGKLHFWMTFIGFNATFFPMHYIGLQGHAATRLRLRRCRSADWNFVISIFSFVLGASFVIFVYNMSRAGRAGRSRRRTRGGAHTLEWQVTSPPPIFNFDEIPQVVGGPYEYGVPGARHAVLSGDRARGRAGGGARVSEQSDERAVLVVANETLVGGELIDAVKRHAEAGPIRVVVVAPVTQPREGYVVYRRHAARGRRPAPRPHARGAARGGHPGARARRRRRPAEPRSRTRSALEDIDEIIVSTHPETKSGWLRQEPRRRRSARPPATSPSSTSSSDDSRRSTGANVLVVANETVLGEPLLDRIRERAEARHRRAS